MKATHAPHFWRRALAVMSAVCLSALMIPLAASYAAAQDNGPVDYVYQLSKAQGTNGFYYVYAPMTEGTPDYANRGEMVLAEPLPFGREYGWKAPGTEPTERGWIGPWDDMMPAVENALGVEFRAPEAGNYSLEAVVVGGDTTVKAGVDKTWGDGLLVELVVNGSAVYTFDTDDWYGYSDNRDEWPLAGRELRKYVYLNEGDTAALYVSAKASISFDELYFQYKTRRYPAVEYEETYSFSYKKDYTGTPYSMTYVPYEGDFAPHAFDNFDLANEVDMVNMEGENGTRSSWVRPDAAHWLDAPFYHDWGEMGAGTGGMIGYQFTAPSKGVYDILHTISNGDAAADTDFSGGDGSEFYLYKNTDQRLFYWDCDNWKGTAGKEQQVINRISLNKGETVTLYVFGKASGAFDNISVGISASKIPAKTVPVENPQVGEDAESYTYGCATAQGNNNFYYVYAPVSGGVPNYAGRGELAFVSGLPGGRQYGWVVPQEVADSDPGYISDWNDIMPSTAYSLGIEFRAPEAGSYSVEALLSGGDASVKPGVVDAVGDGQLVEIVVNGSVAFSFDTDDWFGPLSSDLSQRRLGGRDVRKFLKLNQGDTVALYVYGKETIDYDELYPYFVLTRIPDINYDEEHSYSFGYKADYSGTPFDLVYVPYGGDFAPHAFENFDPAGKTAMVNMAGDGGRAAWVRSGAAHWLDAPFYHDWGEMGAGTNGLIGFQFTAPAEGVYDIRHVLKNGDTGLNSGTKEDRDSGDGSEFYLYKNDAQLLFYQDCDNWCGRDGTEQQVFNRISLAKGDTVTLYVFGKATPNFDNIAVGLTASLLNPEAEAPDETPVYRDPFPMGKGDAVAVGADSNLKKYNGGNGKLTPMKEQGEFNFYYMYAVHNDGEAQLDTLQDAVKADLSKFPNTGALKPKAEHIISTVDNHSAGSFYFTDWGNLGTSSMPYNDHVYGFDAAVQFRAPEEGDYEVHMYLGGGIRINQATGELYDSDGIIWRIFDQDMQEIQQYVMDGGTLGTYDGEEFVRTFHLEEGEGITLYCDQQELSNFDDAFFSFIVTRKDGEDPTQPTSPTGPTEPADPTGPTNPTEPISPNPRPGHAAGSLNLVGETRTIAVGDYRQNGLEADFGGLRVSLPKDAVSTLGVSDQAEIVLQKYFAAAPSKATVDVYGDSVQGTYLEGVRLMIYIRDGGSMTPVTQLKADAGMEIVYTLPAVYEAYEKDGAARADLRFAQRVDGRAEALDTLYYPDSNQLTVTAEKTGTLYIFSQTDTGD